MPLRDLPLRPVLETSTRDLVREFFIPALSESVKYDRGVGYFTSSWLKLAAGGLVGLARNGGRARIVASPILSADDWAALREGEDARVEPALHAAMKRTLDELATDLVGDTLAALAWMVADELLEFRIAVPTADLDGDFHDKFGIFGDANGDALAFHGSSNDSAQAFRNYESIDVFYAWADERDAERVVHHQARFERLWSNRDANVRVFALPEAIRRNLVEFADSTSRPYPAPGSGVSDEPRDDRWRHQRAALAAFLEHRNGVLEMATGTGKTRTALMIMEELRNRGLIKSAIVTAHGTDLLDQWYRQLRGGVFPVYRAYENHREALSYANYPDGALLLASREKLPEVLPRLSARLAPETLLVCDEVHGMGAPGSVTALSDRLSPFGFRLGLSATPEREYDAEGNAFITREIGPVIYKFGLREAIERGILCGFDYVPLDYSFTDEDRSAVQRAIARFHARAKAGNPAPIESLYQEIGKVRKLSPGKLPPFRTYLRAHPELMQRCLVFVETMEYGLKVQEILMEARGRFHTYYGDDERENLVRFAKGELDCLVTCHRISEGIDVRSVNNVVLFSSARARLETIQRLGRCLRIDPENPDKRATVVDFIRVDDESDDPESDPGADRERRDWLTDLATAHPEQ
jgi:superfamily II DNA or RNA helicase